MHTHDERHVHSTLLRLWGLNDRGDPRVPSNQPRSLMRADITTLVSEPYMVGAKADGTRAFLLFYRALGNNKPVSVLVGRDGTLQDVELSTMLGLYDGTLLDGELMPGGVYMAFDLVAVAGAPYREHTHPERIRKMEHVLEVTDMRSLRVCTKPWFRYGAVGHQAVVNSIAPMACDGLVFVPVNGGLHPGTQRDQFKWKSAANHTVDLLLGVDMVLWVGDSGGLVRVDERADIVPVLHDPPSVLALKKPAIAECTLTRDNGKWVASFLKLRLDKKRPNDARTVVATMTNVAENVLVSELMGQ